MRGGVAGLLADRTLPHRRGAAPGLTHAVDRFLGAPATFSDGAFRLAALLRRPVFFMAGLYQGGRRYELRFAPLADFSERPAAPGAERDAARAAAVHALCRPAGAAVPRDAAQLVQLLRFLGRPAPGPQDATHASPEPR